MLHWAAKLHASLHTAEVHMRACRANTGSFGGQRVHGRPLRGKVRMCGAPGGLAQLQARVARLPVAWATKGSEC
eukprot:44209-Chlamydomonas_euryale.AAC.1